MTQSTIQTTKAAGRAMTEVADLAKYSIKKNAADSWDKAGRLHLRQPIFTWQANEPWYRGGKHFYDKKAVS